MSLNCGEHFLESATDLICKKEGGVLASNQHHHGETSNY